MTGLQNTDSSGTICLTYSGNSSGDLSTASVGKYTITASGLRLSDGSLASGNYSISYVTSALTVTQAPLTVTA